MIKTTARKIEITVKRPNGIIEIVDVTEKFCSMNDALFAKMQKANAEAGKGELLSYKVTDATWEKEESNYIEHCHRCSVQIDTRKAYSQMEWTRFGGSPIKVKTYYCDKCHLTLRTIGVGEMSEMEARRSDIPSQEPIDKGDY